MSADQAWMPAQFKIALDDGTMREQKGWTCGPIGLAKGARGRWDFTHLRTGRLCCVVAGTKATAMRIGDAIVALDWDFDDPHDVMMPERFRPLCEALLEHAGHVEQPKAHKLLQGAAA